MARKGWERVQGIIRVLRPWISFRSRRPLVLLVVVCLGLFLFPLAADWSVALLYGLPSWFRRAIGQAMFAALLAVGLWRLGRVTGTDSWPMPCGPEAPEVATAMSRFVPWALRLAVASL